MNPSVKDRLGSVLRALNGVVLPALPKEAGLAQEQVMLAMGHIQIILAQMDAAPAFLDDERADLERLGAEIAKVATGGPVTAHAIKALSHLLADTQASAPEMRTASVQDAIDTVLVALANDGDPAARKTVESIILNQGAARAEKDRHWFAAMGLDIDYSGG